MAIEGLPRVFKLSDVAERWECSKHHVRRVVETGEMRAFRVGRLWRVRLDAIDEYEARAAVEPKAPRRSPPPPPSLPDRNDDSAAAQLACQAVLDRLSQRS